MKTVTDYIEGNLPQMKFVVSQVAFKFHTDRHDLFSKTILVALRYKDKYKDEEGLKGFLAWWYRLTHNQAIDEWRKNARTPQTLDSSNPVVREQIGITTHYANDDRLKLLQTYKLIRRKFSSRASVIMYMDISGL